MTTDPKQVVGRITERIKDNYARLHTVRVILQETSLDRSVTKREEVTTAMPTEVRPIVREPLTVRRERVLLREQDVLREEGSEDGQIWAFHRGVWTQYVPKSEHGLAPIARADARRASPRPEKHRIDGATIDLRRSVARRPRARDRLDADARWAAPSAALMEHTFEPGHKERYRCEFDPARNDLPTRIIVLPDDDKIGIIVLDITYQEVIPGAAWFLKKATCKYSAPNLRDHRIQRHGGRPTSSRQRGRCTSTSRSPTMRSRSSSRVARESPMRSRPRKRKAARIRPLGKERPCARRPSPVTV